MTKKNKKKEISVRSSAAEYLTYISAAGGSKDSIELRYEDENIWLTQKMMSLLYGVSVATINHHISKIYDDCELQQSSTIRNFLIVQKEKRDPLSAPLAGEVASSAVGGLEK